MFSAGATVYQCVVQGDDTDQLWEVDSSLFRTRREAEAAAIPMLREAVNAEEAGAILTAFINVGKIVDIGYEDDPDLIFEAGEQLGVVSL